MVLPDRFIETAAQSEQYEDAGLQSKHIYSTLLQLVSSTRKHFFKRTSPLPPDFLTTLSTSAPPFLSPF